MSRMGVGARPRILVVTGVGTGIGKTHAAEVLLRAWAATGLRVAGYKPIESGVVAGVTTDQDRLDAAATFHVKHPRLELAEPISPHLAARREGRSVDTDAIRAHVNRLATECDGVVVELAGGTFSPIDEHRTNADLVALWPEAACVLVGSDRLGVLHEVIATTRALAPRRVDLVLLSAPEHADASTGTNATELATWLGVPTVAIPRGPATDPRSVEEGKAALGRIGLRG